MPSKCPRKDFTGMLQIIFRSETSRKMTKILSSTDTIQSVLTLMEVISVVFQSSKVGPSLFLNLKLGILAFKKHGFKVCV